MAANQAKDVIEDVNVIVVPTKTIPQGYVAMSMYNEHVNLDQMEADMTGIIADVKSGAVTYAVRDTNMNGVDIREGDFIGIFDKDIVVSVPELTEAAQNLMLKMLDEDSELVTIIYGEGADEDTAEELAEFIEDEFPDVEVLIVKGDQPVYSYVIAVE